MSKLMRLLCCVFCTAILTCAAASVLTVSAATKNTVTTSISKVESKAKGFKVTWSKKSKIKGYQIQYSTSSKFKKSETQTKTISKAKTTSATISKLKGCNKKYYVRVRTYKVVNDKKVYSSWSKAKSVTTLKHKYSSATCTKAKICKYCNKTSGEKLGHKWEEATYTTPETCVRCGKTRGNVLESPEISNYHGSVYTGGSSSKRYHYEAECAGKYSHEITWDEVSQLGLTACNTCVLQ